MNPYPSKEILDSRLRVDEAGNLFWRETADQKWSKRYANTSVGCVGNHGYIVFNLTVDGKRTQLLAHRVVYIMTHGVEPNYIDHADGNRTNNHPSNIRSCTASENLFNKGVTKRSRIGVKGVSIRDIPGRKIRYIAQSSIKGKGKYLGSYDTPEEAAAAHEQHVRKYANDFYR